MILKTKSNFYPWLVFILASSFAFYKYLLQVSPTVMVPELMKTFELTGQSMGNLAAFYFYAYLCMQLPSGVMLDHYSPRKLLTAAIGVCALGIVIFATATSLAMADFGRLMIGIGGAFSMVGTMKLISVWFPANRFALVSGLMMTVAMLGAVFAEAPLAAMVDALGWRQSMWISALAGVGLAILFWSLVRDRKRDASQHAVNTEPMTIKKVLEELKQLAKNKQSWLISIYSGLAFAPISAFSGLWGVPFLSETQHLNRSQIGLLVSLSFIGFAIGAPLAGWLSDRIGRRKPLMILGTALSITLLASIIYFPAMSVTALATALFFFGVFTGFYFISFATMRESNPTKVSGTSIGFTNGFNALFGALTQPLIGKLLDMGWKGGMHAGIRYFVVGNYQLALTTTLLLGLVIALVLMFFVRETFCKPVD